jgi:hypothetical protein
MKKRDLPKSLQEIADVIGLAEAILLASRLGGARFTVPGRAAHDHPLTLAIGQESATILCDYYRGDSLVIPNKSKFIGRRNDVIRDRFAQGAKVMDLALSFGLTERTVYRILGK